MTLKQSYSGIFQIGATISDRMMKNEALKELIKNEFDVITNENNLKPINVLDFEKSVSDLTKYNESPAVKFEHLRPELDFIRDSKLDMRGHTLCWHNQTPDWLFYENYDIKGKLADRELMLKRLENYIASVIGWMNENYPGQVTSWDVVNESITDEGGVRDRLWYKTVGADYILKAFTFAKKYAPEGVKLFYNDYNCWLPDKKRGIINLVKQLKEAGVVDGLGLQGHINTSMNIELYKQTVRDYFSALGLEIRITELDIDMPGNCDFEYQGKYFRDYMKALIDLKNEGANIVGVTLWGVTDDLSWKKGKNPLPFSADLSKKPAYFGMIEATK